MYFVGKALLLWELFLLYHNFILFLWDMKHVDYAVIGAWPWWLTVAAGLAINKKNVLLIEKSAHMGGDCTNHGCVPSKAMIHYARHHQWATLDEALSYVHSKRKHYRDEESSSSLHQQYDLESMQWHARFIDKHTLDVDGTKVRAKKIIIATWSSPVIPSIEGIDPNDVLTNETIFEKNYHSKNLTIIGGGYIGCELGEALHDLGINVTIVQRNKHIVPLEDHDISTTLLQYLQSKWITIHTNCITEKIENKELFVSNKATGETKKIPFDKVLIAAWRKARTKSLSLTKAWIKHSAQWIIVDKYNRTSQKHIYAIGDCVAGNPQFTHWSNNEWVGVVRNILFPFWKESYRFNTLPAAAYTGLEIASVWLNCRDLHKLFNKDEYITIDLPFVKNDRSFLNDHTQGFFRIHFGRLTGRVLWVSVIGHNASELLALGTYAVRHNVSALRLMNQLFAYPTKNEVYRIASQNFVLWLMENLPKTIWLWCLVLVRNILNPYRLYKRKKTITRTFI